MLKRDVEKTALLIPICRKLPPGSLLLEKSLKLHPGGFGSHGFWQSGVSLRKVKASQPKLV